MKEARKILAEELERAGLTYCAGRARVTDKQLLDQVAPILGCALDAIERTLVIHNEAVRWSRTRALQDALAILDECAKGADEPIAEFLRGVRHKIRTQMREPTEAEMMAPASGESQP